MLIYTLLAPPGVVVITVVDTVDGTVGASVGATVGSTNSPSFE